jgi:UDP-MurNAc hydroxylase
MNFQMISHACMLIEHAGRRLLIDPWVVGSAYWRSWWHFPPSMPFNDEMRDADWVYLTHQHFDHFHYPSLRKLRRDITVLVPRLPVPSNEQALAGLGFTHVVPVDHGRTVELAPSWKLTSYQAGWIQDSALVVECGEHTLLDLNDAKLEDAVIEQVCRRHAPFTFMLRSHSAAQAYPDCYSSPDPRDLQLRKPEDYVDDFVAAVTRFLPRYAVPFASNVCFLHPETFDKNAQAITPQDVATRYEADRIEGCEVVIMLPHDSWDEGAGFKLGGDDIFERRDAELEKMAEEVRDKIEAQQRTEAAKELRWETFHEYMSGFLRAIPWPLRFFYRAKVAYHVEGPPEEWWVCDFKRQRVARESTRPADAASITDVAPGLLQDAMEKTIVNFIDISKRLHVELRAGATLQHFIFKELMTLYEEGLLPLRRNLSPRALRVWLRRRKEIASYVRKLLRGGGRSLIPKVERTDT